MKHQAVRANGAVDGSELPPSHHDRFPSMNPLGWVLGGSTDGQDASKRKSCLMRNEFLFPFRPARSLVTILTELFQLSIQGGQRPDGNLTDHLPNACHMCYSLNRVARYQLTYEF